MNRIKQLRHEYDIKQYELSRNLGIKQSMLSKYENEQAPLTNDLILKFTSFFNVSADYLLGIDTAEQPPSKRDRLIDETSEKIKLLPEQQQQIVLDLINSLIANRQDQE